MLGLKSLPVNHPLHRVYQVCAGVLGALLVLFGVLALVTSGDRLLGITASTRFGAGCVVVGLVLIGGAVVGGNVAAQVNAWTGAVLVAAGLLCLLVMRNGSWNVLDVAMSDVMVLFVVGLLALAAGFYGQVGPATQEHRS